MDYCLDLGYIIKKNLHHLFDRMSGLLVTSNSFDIFDKGCEFSEENEQGVFQKTMLMNIQKYLLKYDVHESSGRDRVVLKSHNSRNGRNNTFRIEIKDIKVPKEDLIRIWVSLARNSDFGKFLKSMWETRNDGCVGVNDVKLETILSSSSYASDSQVTTVKRKPKQRFN